MGSTTPHPALLSKNGIFQSAPFRSCHASTIVETPTGMVAGWFAGTEEGQPDVGIWIACLNQGSGWSAPEEIATGFQASGMRYPCWNPVLFQFPSGNLVLFFKVGPSPREWWGMLMRSADGGQSWSPPIRLPKGVIGPVKNKPVLLDDGLLLCPSSTETEGRWQVHLELTDENFESWSAVGPLNNPEILAAIQPAILAHSSSSLQILCRSKQKRIAESWSEDGGKSWQPLILTNMPNPDSGIDAVQLRDGRSILVYNPTENRRTPLCVAVSEDGSIWRNCLTLEDQSGEYSYPAVIQSSDGLVHITYTWKRRRIQHVVLDPGML